MTSDGGDWQRRVDELWDAFDDLPDEEFLARMEALTAERPAPSATVAPTSSTTRSRRSWRSRWPTRATNARRSRSR